MKILYIHQYYRIPSEGGAIRSWYISGAMAQAGHNVEMITAHNKRKYEKKLIGGVCVHYLPVKYTSRFGFGRRISAFLSFSFRASLLGRKISRPDLIYVTSTPLTTGLAALFLKRYHHCPFVFEVRDLWPEAPVQMKIIRNRVVRLAAEWLEKKTCREARAIIALSPGIENHVKKLSHKQPVWMCPNMSDCEFFTENEDKDQHIINEYDIAGKFVIGYFGAIGRANALTYLLEAAKMANAENLNLAFIIVGDGPEKQSLVQARDTSGLENVHFAGHQDKYTLKKYLSVIDAAYVSYARFPVFRTSSPNKFFDALASGKMIISNTGGWIKELIETHHCGFYYDPEESGAFLAKIYPVLHDRELLSAIKKNSRKLAESRFERKILIRELFGFLGI